MDENNPYLKHHSTSVIKKAPPKIIPSDETMKNLTPRTDASLTEQLTMAIEPMLNNLRVKESMLREQLKLTVSEQWLHITTLSLSILGRT